MIVTIDGPAGTGKSTVARTLAERLGFQFLDSGAMYRMIALRTITADVDPQDHAAVVDLTSQTQIELIGNACLLDGIDVKAEIRSTEVTRTASLIAQIPKVRDNLVQRQREIADSRDIVCEGRDQGTVAFPHAECKFFLTALPEVRVRRRQSELRAQGKIVDFEELFREQTARDRRDAERAVAPLKPADDAELIDTTALAADEVVRLLHEKILYRRQTSSANRSPLEK